MYSCEAERESSGALSRLASEASGWSGGLAKCCVVNGDSVGFRLSAYETDMIVVLDFKLAVILPGEANLWTSSFARGRFTSVSIGSKETLGQ